MNKQEFTQKLKDENYEEISTGGGCVAYHKSLGNGWYVLLTDDSGLHLPTSLKYMIIGIYHNELNSAGLSKEGDVFRPKTYKSFEQLNEVINEQLNLLKDKFSN